MRLIDLLKTLPCRSLNNQPVILFSDIVNACRLHGQGNSRIIETKLHELENAGRVKLMYSDPDGDPDMIVGVQVVKP